MNGLKKSVKNRKANDMSNLPIVPTQVTLRGSVGSLDPPRASQLFTFGPRGAGYCTERVENGLKNQQKIGKANRMPSLPSGPTRITKTGNVSSVDVFSEAHLFTLHM